MNQIEVPRLGGRLVSLKTLVMVKERQQPWTLQALNFPYIRLNSSAPYPLSIPLWLPRDPAARKVENEAPISL